MNANGNGRTPVSGTPILVEDCTGRIRAPEADAAPEELSLRDSALTRVARVVANWKVIALAVAALVSLGAWAGVRYTATAKQSDLDTAEQQVEQNRQDIAIIQAKEPTLEKADEDLGTQMQELRTDTDTRLDAEERKLDAILEQLRR